MSALGSWADIPADQRGRLLRAKSRHSFREDSKRLERGSPGFSFAKSSAVHEPSHSRDVPCFGQELRLSWLSLSIVFARENS
jgi:hypothetical protein